MGLMPSLATAATTPSPVAAGMTSSTAVMATTTSTAAPAKMNSTAEKGTTPSMTMQGSTSSTATPATIPSVDQVLILSMAVMATTPSKVVSSSMVAMAMITPHSPPKQQPSTSATETTPLMVLTHRKVKTSTSPLDPEVTTLPLAKIIAKQPFKLAQVMTT